MVQYCWPGGAVLLVSVDANSWSGGAVLRRVYVFGSCIFRLFGFRERSYQRFGFRERASDRINEELDGNIVLLG